MKLKTIAAGVAAAALTTGLLAGSPAQAGKKPVKTTLYFHGGSPIGETETADAVNGIFRTMDTTEPTEPTPKSVALVAAGAAGTGTPNPQCAGSPLFPVWIGEVNGKIVGDVKATIDVVSSPAVTMDVRIWGVGATLACNESYVPPNAEVRVDAPAGPGPIEVTFEDVKFATTGRLMIQYTPVLEGPTAARFLYDSTASVSQIEFSCVPKSGKSCTP